MLLSDKTITELCIQKEMIKPFHDRLIKEVDGQPIPSKGLSSYGYDLTLGNKFKVLREKGPYFIASVSDFPADVWYEETVEDGQSMLLKPNQFCLAVTQEHFKMPDDVMGICMQKSTLARCGLEVVVTPIEAGWSGYLTLEMYNKTPYNLELKPGIGIVQVMFFKGDQPCALPYWRRNGKYQNQTQEPVTPRY